MNHKEIHYIKFFNTLSPSGYNLAAGGKNKLVHQSTRDKISKAKLGKKLGPHTKEHNKKISIAHKGRSYPDRIVSDETRKKISEANSGSKNYMFGKKQSKYNKQRTSEANCGNKFWLGRKHREESKLKISKSKDLIKIKIFCVQTNQQFESIHEASRVLNVARAHINGVLSGRYETAKGLTFKYVEKK